MSFKSTGCHLYKMNIQLPGAEFSENMSTHKMFCLNTGLCQLIFGVFLKYSPHKTFFKKLFHYFIFSKIISFKYHWKEDIPSTNIILSKKLSFHLCFLITLLPPFHKFNSCYSIATLFYDVIITSCTVK